MIESLAKPEGFESHLSNYKTCYYDQACGEPVGWGFEIVRRMSPERFQALSEFGILECAFPRCFLIVKQLTRMEAIEKYGAITAESYGPRGGWRSVTFGETRFISKALRPSYEPLSRTVPMPI
jgi:hypothetical protein